MRVPIGTACEAPGSDRYDLRDRDLRSPNKDKNGMSKGERRGNREAKKPKQDKPKLATPAPNSLAAAVVKAAAPKRK